MPVDPEFQHLVNNVPGFSALTQEEQDQRYAAHLFMRDAHQATAQNFVEFGESFDQHARNLGAQPQGSRMRQAAEHLYHAARLDPFTRLQDGLHGSNTNTFAHNGGFIAFEQEIRQTRAQRQANLPGSFVDMGGQGGANSLEYHPPGGTHVTGNIHDVHGSYVRPRNAGRQRAMSIGIASADGSRQVSLPGDGALATTDLVRTRLATARGQ